MSCAANSIISFQGSLLIMFRLLPLLCICYMLQFLDKSSLNYATLMNIRQDLVCNLSS